MHVTYDVKYFACTSIIHMHMYCIYYEHVQMHIILCNYNIYANFEASHCSLSSSNVILPQQSEHLYIYKVCRTYEERESDHEYCTE